MVLLAAFSTNLTLTILTIALAPIALDLHVSIGDVAWVTLAPMVVSAVVTPAAGRLADRAGHLPRQMSGGQQQRVAIARAIVAGPTLLLADEPTGNLDAKAAAAVLDLLTTMHQRFGWTLLMVTHDPRAAAVASRVVHLDKGRITSDERNAPLAEATS